MSARELSALEETAQGSQTSGDRSAARPSVAPVVTLGIGCAVLAGLILSPAAGVNGLTAAFHDPMSLVTGGNTTCCPPYLAGAEVDRSDAIR
jgi:hypothetical protein